LRFRRTALDVPLLLFCLTLFIGLWTAYSIRLALYKFWVVLAAVGVYYVVTAVPRRYAWWVAVACGPVAAGLAVYFVTADWWHSGLGFVGQLFKPARVMLSLRTFWPLLLPHPNVIGGLITMLIPFMLATLLYARREGRQRWLAVTAVSLSIALFGLIFTKSLGAIIALAVGLGLWALWPISKWVSRPLRLSRGTVYALLVGTMVAATLYILWWTTKQDLPGHQSLTGRYYLLRSTWRLIEDYSWTGSGLATFAALYAEHMRVVPNFFVAYSNFYLDVLLELGFIGFISFFCIWAGALWLAIKGLRRSVARPHPERGEVYWLRWATLASLVIVLIYGLTDDILFSGLAVPLLFFTPAMVVLVSQRRAGAEVVSAPVNRRSMAWIIAVALLILAGVLFSFRQRILADWYANQGALLMDHVLLRTFPRDSWRESAFITRLQPARSELEQAIQLDKDNRTASQRLGMMALLGRDFDTAVSHLEIAHQQDPQHRGVTKMLGYAYIWQGQPETAVTLLARIPEAQSELESYIIWWQQQHRPELAEYAAITLTLLQENSSE
jgi:O-antigen ligase